MIKHPYQKPYFGYTCAGCGKQLYRQDHIVLDGKFRAEWWVHGEQRWQYLNKGMAEKIFVCSGVCLDMWTAKRRKEIEDERISRLRREAEQEERERNKQIA